MAITEGFVKDISKIRLPMANMLKKIIKYEWTEKCEREFQELRLWLTTTLILPLPVKGKEYTIYSDALENGLGYVLMQEDKVIAYASW